MRSLRSRILPIALIPLLGLIAQADADQGYSGPAKPSEAPAVQLVLWPACESIVFSEAILDEGVWVQAESGRSFLTLPFVYDTKAAGISISRASLKGRDAKSFVGIRLLAPKDGHIPLEGNEGLPIYEKFEIGGKDHEGQVTARDTGPLRSKDREPDKARINHSKPRSESVTPTGWAALVFDVPNNGEHLLFQWDGGTEDIELNDLRNAIKPISLLAAADSDPEKSDVVPPAVAESLQATAEAPASMAALSIHRLSRNRKSWPNATTARWVASVDSAILAAGGRDEPIVQLAAWEYFRTDAFAGRPLARVSPAVADFIAAADEDLERHWIDAIARGLGLTDLDYIWSLAGSPRGSDEAPEAFATKLLSILLQSEDEAVCASAAATMIRIPSAAQDTTWLTGASPAALRNLLAGLEKVKDASTARRFLRAMLRLPQSVPPLDLAKQIERVGLVITPADEGIFAVWDDLGSARDCASMLTALAAADLRAVIYSERSNAILGEALTHEDGSAAESQALRESAWALALRQHARLLPGESAARKGGKRAEANGDVFPLLVARSARDSIVQTLGDAAKRAPRGTRSQALIALLQSGFSEEAARALLDSATAPNQREVLLKEIATKVDTTISRESYLALLGHLLRRESKQNAGWILAKIGELRSRVADERRWRLSAALKAGINFSELDRLAITMPADTGASARQLLHELGHMTPQDQERLAAAAKPEERAAILDRIDFRRGQLPAGKYGVLAVMETISMSTGEFAETPAGSAPVRWNAPTRSTYALPALVIENREPKDSTDDSGVSVLLDGKPIGQGFALNKPKSVGGPGRFSPVLQAASWRELSEGRQNGPGQTDAAIGPVVLQHRAVLVPLAPGTMTIETSEYLRTALGEIKAFKKDELDTMVPTTYPVTLRYASFGSYYGCGPELPLPEYGKPAPQRRLLGVMLILERMD